MTGAALPDRLVWRRVAELERQVERLQQELRALSQTRGTTPLSGRLWRVTLNEEFGNTTAHIAAADLLTLSGTDTGLDVSVYDPLDIFATLSGSEAMYVVEQIDMDGKRRFVPLQSVCPGA